jgi:hypothetical protein
MPKEGPTLDVLEEAFTSENWIVRIYKVKDEDLLGRDLKSANAFAAVRSLSLTPLVHEVRVADLLFVCRGRRGSAPSRRCVGEHLREKSREVYIGENVYRMVIHNALDPSRFRGYGVNMIAKVRFSRAKCHEASTTP